ncbi:hypothetical protein AOC03_11960 (plasmid) [Psychrobacter urativorans]|uniref:MobA/MobL protein domain-containing protein n=2 Tax=Psychrobacter urativorans TaxID=45610 RepID=A0A0M5MLH6_9GAMM|nr:hypothetical protein AOC03_11960 [Psychrobacter urativorans]
MAIVHIETKAISRKAGQSAVASAAYRAGVILNDVRYDKTHDYSKKSGVMSADIILPSTLQAKGVMVSREEIWNKAENVEGRSDSRVAREWLVNLPHELNEDKRKSLAHEFAQALADKYNIIADCAIHSPSKKEVARGADPRNYHAHILVTTREAQLDANGSLFFDKQFKIPFEWSNKKRAENNLQSSIQEIKDIRQLWVDMANKALVELDITPLDARSFKDQGLDRLPTIKMGVDATHMERKGIKTDKGNENRAIRVINQRKAITKLRSEDERHVHEYIEWSGERIDWTAHRHQQVIKCLDDSQQRIESSQRDIASAARRSQLNQSVAEANLSNAEWANKRAKRLIEITDRSQQRVERDQQQAIVINNIIAESANRTPAPSPFDDHASRARATRLAEQKRRFDSAATRGDRETRYRDRQVEDAYQRAERNKQQLALLFVFRHNDTNRLKAKWMEDPDDYPDKFDYRQSDLLDQFSKDCQLERHEGEEIHSYHQRITQLMTADFRSTNQEMVNLLRDPKTERAQYNAIKQEFEDFVQALDKQREDHKDQIRLPIERLNATTDMVKVVATAVNYLQKLDDYINNETTVETNKTLAREHRGKIINRTVEAYRIACFGIPNFQIPVMYTTHTEALQGSLNNFTKGYGNELSKEQLWTLNRSYDDMSERRPTLTYKLRR